MACRTVDSEEEQEIREDIKRRLNKHAAEDLEDSLFQAYNNLQMFFGLDELRSNQHHVESQRSSRKLRSFQQGEGKGGVDNIIDSVNERLLRRVMLQSHGMVVGLSLDELLDTLEIYRYYQMESSPTPSSRAKAIEKARVKWLDRNSGAEKTHAEPSFVDAFEWFEAVGKSSLLRNYWINEDQLRQTHEEEARGKKFHSSRQYSILAKGVVDDAGEPMHITDEQWDEMKRSPEKTRSVRVLFLNILRQQYWDQIESQKLVDEDGVAQTLLYTIDVARDKIEYTNSSVLESASRTDPSRKALYSHPWDAQDRDTISAFADWPFVAGVLRFRGKFRDTKTASNPDGDGKLKQPFRFMTQRAAKGCVRYCTCLRGKVPIVGDEEAKYEITKAYIQGHIEAQRLLAKYVGGSDDIDMAEEKFVIMESKKAVAEALKAFGKIFDTHAGSCDRDLVTFLIAKKRGREIINSKIREVHRMKGKHALRGRAAASVGFVCVCAGRFCEALPRNLRPHHVLTAEVFRHLLASTRENPLLLLACRNGAAN